ncbi:MAG: pilus assembly protein TadG-related protein, partial [Candidatus Binatus sp.]
MAICRYTINKEFTVAASARGQVMVLICVSLIALVGMVAVVSDFSFMQHQRNMMQTAADSAAMAGAEELNYGDLVVAGKADAATNGYTDGTNNVTVSMNNPPSTGPNAANSGYVEAIVSEPAPTYFLRVLGVSSMTVSADEDIPTKGFRKWIKNTVASVLRASFAPGGAYA